MSSGGHLPWSRPKRPLVQGSSITSPRTFLPLSQTRSRGSRDKKSEYQIQAVLMRRVTHMLIGSSGAGDVTTIPDRASNGGQPATRLATPQAWTLVQLEVLPLPSCVNSLLCVHRVWHTTEVPDPKTWYCDRCWTHNPAVRGNSHHALLLPAQQPPNGRRRAIPAAKCRSGLDLVAPRPAREFRVLQCPCLRASKTRSCPNGWFKRFSDG